MRGKNKFEVDIFKNVAKIGHLPRQNQSCIFFGLHFGPIFCYEASYGQPCAHGPKTTLKMSDVSWPSPKSKRDPGVLTEPTFCLNLTQVFKLTTAFV